MGPVDDYLATLDEPSRAAFDHVRTVAESVVPEAGQTTSYGMAALTHSGKPLLCFLAAKKHLSLFPCSGAAVAHVRDRLDGFSLATGTIRFHPDQPVPDDVLRDLVSFRVAEIDTRGR